MKLSNFVDRTETTEPTLVFANRKRANQTLVDILTDMFDDQEVTVVVDRDEDIPDDQLVVIRDGRKVAQSSLNEFIDTIILANEELYTSEPDEIPAERIPDVIKALEDVTFEIDATQSPNKVKLLLIVMSRYIEARALRSAEGTLRTGFQKISRLRDERGTKAVYRQLGESPVETHVYGVVDWIPPEELVLTVHGGDSSSYRDHWFVVFDPPADSSEEGMGLLAEKIDNNRWRGTWSSDEEFVDALDDYIDKNL